MKLIIFAGGSGTRLWPLSKKHFPKQFKKMFDGKSTLELALERVVPHFGLENIYLSTNDQYERLITQHLPFFPKNQIILEPEKRDLAPAVGLNLAHLKALGYHGPVAILWADHLMKNVDDFITVLKDASNHVLNYSYQIAFIAEKPRFANNNLGWIKLGSLIESNVYSFLGWRYKPEVKECLDMYKSGEWYWNPGYFVFDLDNMLEKYRLFQPKMYQSLIEISSQMGTSNYYETLRKIYPTLEKINFDKAIAEKIDPSDAVVFKVEMGWSDPGTLFALKEALVGEGIQNYASGLNYLKDTQNSLIINEDKDKLVATLGLENMIVVNTHDALIIIPKDKVVDLSKLVEDLEKDEALNKFV